MTRASMQRLSTRIWLPVLLVVVWWFSMSDTRSLYFPSLQNILQTFARDWLSARVVTDLFPSLRSLALGFLLAGVLGIVGGACLGSNRLASAAAAPMVHFLRSLPPPVLLPLGLLLLGTGASMKVAIITVGALWPTLLNTMEGVRGVDPQLRDVASVYRLTRAQKLRYVTLPAAAPQILAGLRTTLQISIILIVVSEMVGSSAGIGYYVLLSQQTFAVPETWAGTLLLGIIGFVCNLLFGMVERPLLHWQTGPRAIQDRADA